MWGNRSVRRWLVFMEWSLKQTLCKVRNLSATVKFASSIILDFILSPELILVCMNELIFTLHDSYEQQGHFGNRTVMDLSWTRQTVDDHNSGQGHQESVSCLSTICINICLTFSAHWMDTHAAWIATVSCWRVCGAGLGWRTWGSSSSHKCLIRFKFVDLKGHEKTGMFCTV